MFFGGINGINSFFPHNIKDNPHIPPIVITDFKVFDQSIKIGKSSLLRKSITYTKTITMSYEQNIFSFRFAALDYTYPRKNQYKYKVEGLHDNWIYLGYSDEVSFIGMKPGKYTFRVSGSNNDGVWNEEGTALKIIVTPPFWETSWFKAIVVLSVGFAIYLLFRTYTKRLTLQLETEKAMNRIYTKNRISAREQEIVNLLLKGKSNKEIEDTLFISLSTVKTHVYNIYKKLKVKNRVELLRLIQQSVKSE
jgi:DNA-binding CsgD family transcriptional regulator